jgi:hypothetical protein
VKLTRSPVFRSKFCHFLFPKVFPVADNRAMGSGGRAYEDHFNRVRELWRSAPQEDLKALLQKHFERQGADMFSGFPVANKIVELCLIGRRHPGSSPECVTASSS